MMLALTKDLAGHDRALRAGDWAYRHGLTAGELAGATLLLIGFGRIGQALARRAVAFGMHVQVHDPYVSDDLLDQMAALGHPSSTAPCRRRTSSACTCRSPSRRATSSTRGASRS